MVSLITIVNLNKVVALFLVVAEGSHVICQGRLSKGSLLLPSMEYTVLGDTSTPPYSPLSPDDASSAVVPSSNHRASPKLIWNVTKAVLLKGAFICYLMTDANAVAEISRIIRNSISWGAGNRKTNILNYLVGRIQAETGVIYSNTQVIRKLRGTPCASLI